MHLWLQGVKWKPLFTIKQGAKRERRCEGERAMGRITIYDLRITIYELREGEREDLGFRREGEKMSRGKFDNLKI